ncbi:ABC transporter, permease protein [Fusobacterium necrophorum subsp. funduliforme ATCC 51357]|uniref:Iron ABC transporter permease n=3 Tax=Fusobacterium necrophorum TaxID=859 RepID=A0A162IPM1_9FUSO|nr:iron ABC transporter permease [Fusobacterium necrophorum]EIJ71038.1 ABC transporter, permease protein [Fusobacterium necrophorum subsp. funduliforme ATCC 51357]KAB0553460.1 iron ABC transporter permease [Fusobacterium necrophorum subsp. funduliforme]KDE60843.1 iron ABC transporter permease [Fusobacterium necrophorum DJ-1]KDE66850.1 iron ABC transporter permease [Fusobacterium necrophorum BFTR-1]KDE70858.1 iron ABC transporter permease [Fusobacterium necrophorum DAB]
MKTKKREIWLLVSLLLLTLYSIFMIYPLATLFKNAVIRQDGSFTLEYFIKFLGRSYYFSTIFNSFKISICVTFLTLFIGIPLAYFFNMYKIKGKPFLQIIIILCSMSAPFIGAYSWILLLGRNGLVTNLIKNILGIKVPSIYGFGGILLVLSLQLYPLVFLYVSGALRNIDNSLLEASENMGCSGVKQFFTIIIPLCIPSILAAGLMVFMISFADFGTPLFIGEGYRTFPVEIYNQFMNETGTDKNFAAAISIIAITITTIIFLIQKYINSKFRFTMNALHPIEAKEVKGIKAIFAHIFCYGIVFLAYAPQLYVFYTSFQNTSGKLFVAGYSFNSYIEAFRKVGTAIKNTFFIGGTALCFIVLISVLIAYLAVRRNSKLNKVLDTLSMVPQVIPGSVIGIALITGFNKPNFTLVGTFLIMIIALVIRRNAYTVRSSVAILQQIPLSIEEAAISLGTSKLKTFFQVTVPMMLNGVVSGALLSWITIITELSSGVILYNYKTITLTIQIYTYVSRGSYGVAAALAAILSSVTILSLVIFMKVSKNQNIMM